MSKQCSLRLDIVQKENKLGWQIFHRKLGRNESIAGLYPMPSVTSPAEIIAALSRTKEPVDIHQLKNFGIWAMEKIFPDKIIRQFEDSDEGDILFMVPVNWADIPFELFFYSKGFLGQLFRIGTIIVLSAEVGSRKVFQPRAPLLIVADPAHDLPSAYQEGIQLKSFCNEKNWPVHLLTSADKTKIISEIKKAGIVHFAGHSVDNHRRDLTGWKFGKEILLNIIDIEKIGSEASVPWLVFSNSCYGGNNGAENNFSGIAGAFLKAGVLQVIGPVQEVHDAQAFLFAKNFYNSLFNGLSCAEALFLAKQELLTDNAQGLSVLFYRLFGDPCSDYAEQRQPLSPIVHKILSQPIKLLVIVGVLLSLLLLIIAIVSNSENIFYIPPK